MFRATATPLPRLLSTSTLSTSRAALLRQSTQQRCLSTAPPTQKSRSWKSLAARVGAAGGLVYWYNSTEVFAEERRYDAQTLPPSDAEVETEAELQTIESLSAQRRERKAVQAQLDTQRQSQPQSTGGASATAQGTDPEQLESEADQQGAFNPETGEINWDCPCLGGMAHGPCGEEFKAAFSCFVYSTEEPKGMDCIDRFKHMQNCFREYPEVYGAELEADAAAEKEEAEEDARAAAAATTSPGAGALAETETAASLPKSSQPDKAVAAEVEIEPVPATSTSTPTSSQSASSPTATPALSLVPPPYKPGQKEEKDD